MINAFQNVVDKSKGKANKIWVDKGSELHNKLITSFLHNNDTVIYQHTKN